MRAASANRVHSAALLRNWSKLGKSASIPIHVGNERAVGSKNDFWINWAEEASTNGRPTKII